MRYPGARWAFILLFAGLSATAQAQTPDEVNTLIKQGVALYDEGKYDEAVLRYKQALKLAPDNSTAQYELAMTYGELGRHQEAIDLCKQLLKKEDGVDPGVYVTYGTALDDLKKPQEAIRIYQTGIKKFPGAGMLYYNLAVTQAGIERYDEARASLQQSVRLNPGHASSHMSLAVLTMQDGNRVPAVLELVRFLQLEPRGQRAVVNLERLDKLLGQGVKRVGKKAVEANLTVTGIQSMNRRKGQPDNFALPDVFLTLAEAKDYQEESKGKSATQRLAEKLDMLGQSLEQEQPDGRRGFAWEYYVPYFITLQKAGYLPTLAYLIQAARPGQPEAQQWLEQHPGQVKELQEWSEAYKWPQVVK